MTLPVGSIAKAPIARVPWVSLIGTQLLRAPRLALVVFQTPPPAVPTYITEELVGFATTLVTRPLAFPYVLSGAVPQHFSLSWGCGPIDVQAPPTGVPVCAFETGTR